MAESHPNLHAEIRMLWWAVTVTDAETLECTGRILALVDLTSGERDLDWGGGKGPEHPRPGYHYRGVWLRNCQRVKLS